MRLIGVVKEDGGLFAERGGHEDEVAVGEGGEGEAGPGAEVLVLLADGPAAAEDLALGLAARPEQPHLLLPLEVLHLLHVLAQQRVHDVALVDQETHDVLHCQLLHAVQRNVRQQLLLLKAVQVTVEGFDQLVNPEVEPQTQTLQGLLIQVLHNNLLVVRLLASHKLQSLGASARVHLVISNVALEFFEK